MANTGKTAGDTGKCSPNKTIRITMILRINLHIYFILTLHLVLVHKKYKYCEKFSLIFKLILIRYTDHIIQQLILKMLPSEWDQQFKQDMIMEWYQVYINFIAIRGPLNMVASIYAQHHEQLFTCNRQKVVYKELSDKDQQKLESAYQCVTQMNILGKYKFRAFYMFKKYELSLCCILLSKVLKQLSVFNTITHEQCQQRQQLKVIIKLIYINVRYLYMFINTNRQIYDKVTKMVEHYGMPFLLERNVSVIVREQSNEDDQPRQIRNTSINSSVKRSKDQNLPPQVALSKIQRSQDQLKAPQSILIPLSCSQITSKQWNEQKQLKFVQNLQVKMTELYKKLVYFDERKTNRLQSLAEIKLKPVSPKTYLLVGLYAGMSIVAILAVCLLLTFRLVKIVEDDNRIDSMKYVFPMFRGIGLFIFYLWGMAFNVFVFNKFRISYRRILQYGHHYSTAFIIMKRAAFFTLLFFSMLMVYFIGASFNTTLKQNSIRFPVEYTPFVVWIIYMGYIFFPNREVFNPEGRKYFYKVLVSVIKSPLSRVNFLISWVTDQSVSFVIPIKDLGYTICFFTSDFNNGNPYYVKSYCMNKTAFEGFVVAYLIALIPLLFRMIQCYRQAIQDTGKFRGHIQMWNFGKYCTSVITSTFSFISAIQQGNSTFLVLFICSSICSTLYAYYWDLKYDWGFLETSTRHKFLRNHLSYQNAKFYYYAIFLNLLFRLAWTLTLSPLITNILESAVLIMVIGMIQIIRRCIWNFFRIEKEHIIYCKNYAATPDIFKQIQIINSMDEPSIRALPQNFEYETLPYFYNSSQEEMHQIQILPAEYIRAFNENKIGLFKNQFESLISEEKKCMKQLKDKLGDKKIDW